MVLETVLRRPYRGKKFCLKDVSANIKRFIADYNKQNRLTLAVRR
jgi:hypothetical protein